MMKCEYYVMDKRCSRTGKYKNEICPHCGKWENCEILIGLEKTDFRRMELEEFHKGQELVDVNSYNYLKGFYDGVKAVIDK